MAGYVIHDTVTGVARSYASSLSLVANPLPAGLTAAQITDPEYVGITTGTHRWDAPTLAVVAITPTVQETNQADLLSKADLAIAANDNWLAIANPTNAQAVSYLDTVAKELTGLAKLVRAAYGHLDALDNTNGT